MSTNLSIFFGETEFVKLFEMQSFWLPFGAKSESVMQLLLLCNILGQFGSYKFGPQNGSELSQALSFEFRLDNGQQKWILF